MSEIKNISKLLEYFSNHYKDEYAIATSILLYIDTSTQSAIEKEILKKINIFKNDNTNIDYTFKRTLEILEDLKQNLGLKYGEYEKILYDDKFTIGYKFISDFCKGSSMINSIYSREYVDMSNKGYTAKLSQLLIKINNNLKESINEKKSNNLDTIRNSEINYIIKIGMNKANQGIKLLNFHEMIEKDREEYIKKTKIKEQKINQENEKNKIIAESIGFFLLYNHTIYDIQSNEYNHLINLLKEEFKIDAKLKNNINEIAINVCEKYISQITPLGNNQEGLKFSPEKFIRFICNMKIKLNKEIAEDNLVQNIRLINSYLKYGIDNVKVKTIVEEILNNKKIENTIKNIHKDTKQEQEEKVKSTSNFRLSNLNPFRTKK